MTTALSTMPAPSDRTAPDRIATPVRPLRFSTLTSVEFRKMTDTRSGRWLLVTILGLVGGVLVYKITQSRIDVAFGNYSRAATTVVAFLAPVIGLLAMTSEWTQRTALTTFTLAPRRLPVIAAKYVAAITLSLAVLAVALLMAAAATAIGGLIHGDASFAGAMGDIRTSLIIVVLQVTMAAAFGALAAQTAVALVAYLAAPTAWALVADGLQGVAPWFDVFTAYDQLSSSQPFDHLAQTLTAITVWVVVPSVVGIVRSLRREVK
jgi:ABC-type transport system involved in multi-copper enzyme maturation permease subunit